MPQIAQQDYLRVEINAIPEDITDADKARILELHHRGILMDALLVFNHCVCRVLVDDIYNSGEFSFVYNGEIVTIAV